jgi:Domain of unknown function (DUF4172)
MYIHELQDWPRFDWNRERLAEPLADVRHRQSRYALPQIWPLSAIIRYSRGSSGFGARGARFLFAYVARERLPPQIIRGLLEVDSDAHGFCSRACGFVRCRRRIACA